MCGIIEDFAFRAELRTTRHRMARRELDDFGEWFTADGRLGFGHRRLSIQDPSERGAQPRPSADGPPTVYFNGDVDNYAARRQELEAEGVVFRSASHTEVLLHLYRRDGEQRVMWQLGMFAFGISNAARQRLFLARDPFGIRLLCVANDGKTLRLASEFNTLLAGAIVTEQGAAGLVGFYTLGCAPEPYTAHLNVRA